MKLGSLDWSLLAAPRTINLKLTRMLIIFLQNIKKKSTISRLWTQNLSYWVLLLASHCYDIFLNVYIAFKGLEDMSYIWRLQLCESRNKVKNNSVTWVPVWIGQSVSTQLSGVVGRMEKLLLGGQQVGRVVQTVQRVEEVHLQGIKTEQEKKRNIQYNSIIQAQILDKWSRLISEGLLELLCDWYLSSPPKSTHCWCICRSSQSRTDGTASQSEQSLWPVGSGLSEERPRTQR